MFRGIRFIPSGTKFPFMSFRQMSMAVSTAAMAVSIVLVALFGLNFGIDFKGGTLMQVRTLQGDANISDIRSKVSGLGLGDVQIQHFGAPPLKSIPI